MSKRDLECLKRKLETQEIKSEFITRVVSEATAAKKPKLELDPNGWKPLPISLRKFCTLSALLKQYQADIQQLKKQQKTLEHTASFTVGDSVCFLDKPKFKENKIPSYVKKSK